jgi:hypothetical protein
MGILGRCENQGGRADLLNSLVIGGFSVAVKAQIEHLLGHQAREA